MKCLLVGAGAVGQVYGFHLQRGGAHVTFLVKERHVADARAGFSLIPLPGRQPVRLDTPVTADAQASGFDVVMLCVSSSALRGPWLPEVLKANPLATVVTLQPGPEDASYVESVAGKARVVQGMISMIAYAAPLPGDALQTAGTAYWFPPLAPSLFGGAADRVRPLVELFRRGGMPAKASRHVSVDAQWPGALLNIFVAVLQTQGWTWKLATSHTSLWRTCAVTHEAWEALALHGLQNPPWPLKLALRPRGLQLALPWAPRLVPLNLEAYLKQHFTKVREQTLRMVETYARLAQQHGVPHVHLDALLDELRSLPP